MREWKKKEIKETTENKRIQKRQKKKVANIEMQRIKKVEENFYLIKKDKIDFANRKKNGKKNL